MATKIQDITTEKQFLSRLRTFYRRMRKGGRSRRYMPFLSILEHTGPSTAKFDDLCERYFAVGCGYDWQRGNSLLQAKTEQWESELQAQGIS